MAAADTPSGTVTAWDEHLHFEEVRRRKREIYNVVFQAKVYESLLAPLQPTASQLPATQLALPKSVTQDTAASSQLSIFDPSGNSSIFSSSASQPSATVSISLRVAMKLIQSPSLPAAASL